MNVVVATAAGMCFGVRDALAILETLDSPCSVAIDGELVHNDVVLHQLNLRGFQQICETSRDSIPDADRVVVTAHGISDLRRQTLINAGKTLVDTTCPLVRRVHHAAQAFANAGAFVVVLGKLGHVEVRGIVEDLVKCAVVPEVSAVERWDASLIGIVCQTTFPLDDVAAIRNRIAELNPQATIRFRDTVCQPTKDRQRALQDLLPQVDAVVVVGGRQSHNTRRLVEACQAGGLPVRQIQEAAELDLSWLAKFETVGLTAGTSTLPETLREVHTRMLDAANLSSTGTRHDSANFVS